jgi:hypothetical protein
MDSKKIDINLNASTGLLGQPSSMCIWSASFFHSMLVRFLVLAFSIDP